MPSSKHRRPSYSVGSPAAVGQRCWYCDYVADFSHYAGLQEIQPDAVVWFAKQGCRPTDEMFLEAFDRIDPPLLAEAEARVVRSGLLPRRGRPRKGTPSVEDVVGSVSGLDRADVHHAFVELLADRLRSGTRWTQARFEEGLLRSREKRERKSFVWCIYQEIYARLSGGDFIDHPVLGRLNVPKAAKSRSDQAREMTQFVLSQRLKRHPPSVRTMLNIVTERNRRAFR